MKKTLMLILFTAVSVVSWGQPCAPSCDKKSCGPEGTKKAEAAVISGMRADIQTVLKKMSASALSFDKQIAEMKIEKGETDDESLLYLSQAITAIRYELLNKLESSRIIGSLKTYRPAAISTKQQLVSSLKKEIEMLASQAENL